MSTIKEDFESGKQHILSRTGAAVSVLATTAGAIEMASDVKKIAALAGAVMDERTALGAAFIIKTISLVPEGIMNTLGSIASHDKNFDVIPNTSPDAFNAGLGIFAVGLVIGVTSFLQYKREQRDLTETQ